ncbi:AlbA family DNA-binding domain-containing protein [Rufibacter quisquiliarum]|uniref:Putative HTH transcriptional regulator n=1 Tax=Rufibacter quisquiliarum TaxID=1549639 RepID=A0A839GRJ8_9BACT|nr:ATP-binding protein [Rufibacter quisquiliarum]MBA9077507.1 putative HTH transcriptional regulator [Rufibacter quisquiliarum]
MQEMLLLILKGESDTLEFKKTITNPDRIARTLVSFANTRGGQILVGVQDNGTICGVDPEEEKHTLEQAISFFCDPPVRVVYKEVEMDEGTILKVIVPESATKPHLAKVKEGDWRSYVRVKDESVQTSKLVEKSLILEPAEEAEEAPLNHQHQRLLLLLQKHRKLTLKQVMHHANLSRRRAQRLLVELVLQGKVRLHDKEKEPYFTLS